MSEKNPNSYEDYTGRQAEEELLEKCPGPWDGETYLNFEDSIDYVKNNQPANWLLSDPAPRFVADLFATVADKLHLEDWNDLKLYTALGTPLDYFHGTDAFFEYDGIRITLDVSINRGKGTCKADFEANPRTMELEVIADGVANRIRRQIKSRAKVTQMS